jgi:hypothetical protein
VEILRFAQDDVFGATIDRMKQRWFTRILPLLIALLAIVHLFRSPYSASNCEVIPETGEYAIGAQRLATLGRYDLEIDRVSYPPRYPPYLSVMMTPLYWLSPGEIGMGIILVLAFAVGAALCAYHIGRALSNEFGGVCAALLLINHQVFSWDARQIVPDVPALALSLACCAICLHLWRKPNASWRWFLIGGLCAGLAGAMRTLNYATLLPLLCVAIFPLEGEAPAEPSSVEPRERLGRSLALQLAILPSLLFGITTAIYNHVRFGSIFKDGYQFWAPIPHQFFHLLFSPNYLSTNVRALSTWWWLFVGGVIGLVLIWRIRRAISLPLFAFVLLAALPISLIHLFYFWGDPRFHLLLIAMTCIAIGAGAGLLFGPSLKGYEWALPIVVIASAFIPINPPTPEPERRIIADQLAAHTPDDAIIITAIDPVYLEPFLLRGTHRKIIPISREVEYAAQLIAPQPLGPVEPPPTDPVKPRIPQMFAAGAKDVVPFTADENPDQILKWASEGKPVYIELRQFPENPKTRELAITLARVLKQVPRQ